MRLYTDDVSKAGSETVLAIADERTIQPEKAEAEFRRSTEDLRMIGFHRTTAESFSSSECVSESLQQFQPRRSHQPTTKPN
jgi:hypothetical protein